jgi:hypothetical protein
MHDNHLLVIFPSYISNDRLESRKEKKHTVFHIASDFVSIEHDEGKVCIAGSLQHNKRLAESRATGVWPNFSQSG